MDRDILNVFKFSEQFADTLNLQKDDPIQKVESVNETVEGKEVDIEWLQKFEACDCRVAMIGNVDSGKSTLVGVLANSCLDDGRGIARSLVLKHRHEKDNGRTSAVTLEIMGFKGDEQVLPTSRNHIQRWTEVATNSTRTVTLIDLCGHEKYLKTTLFGLTGLLPDFGFLIVGSNMGVQVMTKEHISIACALNLPLFVAVTKVDMCPPNILQNTKRTLAKILRSCGRMPFPVKDMSAVDTAIDNITHMYDRVTPVFTISCVSGQGIDLLRSFISKLRRNEKRYYEEIDRNDNDVVYDSHVPDTYYQIDSVYEVKGVGIIVGGTIRRGIIRLNDNNNLYIGPDRNGIFHHINIRSMECRHVPITEAKIGQCITLAIKSVNRKVTLQRSWFRRGMVIMDSNTIHNATTSIPRGIDVNMPRAVREFDASVLILHHSTTICRGYQPLIHCGVLRQSAEIIDIRDHESLKTGERAEIRFRFVYFAEMILPGDVFLFREGRAKGIGKVLRRFFVGDEQIQNTSTTKSNGGPIDSMHSNNTKFMAIASSNRGKLRAQSEGNS